MPKRQHLLLLGKGLYSERKQEAHSERHTMPLTDSSDQSGYAESI